jgi:hypothetical protein
MSGITAFAVLGRVTGGRCVALQWCRLDRNVPYILSNLFVGQQSRIGFVVMMLGNLLWCIIGLQAEIYGMIIANLGFFHEHSRLH